MISAKICYESRRRLSDTVVFFFPLPRFFHVDGIASEGVLFLLEQAYEQRNVGD